jgi:hypothetical protein
VLTNYSFLVPVSGGIPPYSCASAGALPSGLALSVATSNQGCLFSGLLAVNSGGVYPNITVTATDSVGGHATNSPPYSMTIIYPQSLGPPQYLGAIQGTQSIQLPTTLPVMGTNACPSNPLPCYTLGAGTVVSDPSFNSGVPPITIRADDANTECGTRNGFTVFADIGGSGDVNLVNTNDTKFVLNDQGNAVLMFSFNPTTYAIAPMYPSIYGCPGGRGLLNVPPGEFSYSNPNYYFGFGSASSCSATVCPNVTSLTRVDVTSSTAPVFTNVFDFKNCLPSGAPVPSWVEQGGVDVSDNYFALAASITGGGQNTGGDAMFFDKANQACYLYDTIGNLDPARAAIGINGASASYVKSSQSVVISVANSFTSGQTLYIVGITGAMNILNGYAITLTATSTSTISGTLTSSLGHADASGTIAGGSCSGTPTFQCPNIGTMEPAVFKFTGPIWTQALIGYVSSTIGSQTIHNDKISKNGSFDVVAPEICLTTCASNSPIMFWLPEAVTPTVYQYNNTGGHWSEGNNVWFNEGASSNPYFAWEGFPINNQPTIVPPNPHQNFCTSSSPHPGNAQCLINPLPVTCSNSLLPNPCIKRYDGHPNWNTNNPTFQVLWSMAADTTPITTDIYSAAWVYGATIFGPYINEVVVVNACVFNSVLPSTCNAIGNAALREGSTYNSGLNTHFDTKYQIGFGSQTGKFYFYSTDHGGQFGQQPGVGTSLTITSISITSLVGTFSHATSSALTAGEQVALYGFTGSLVGLNGLYATVSATGLTTTQFQATLPAGTANIGATSTNASATLVTCVLGALTNCRGGVEIRVLQ